MEERVPYQTDSEQEAGELIIKRRWTYSKDIARAGVYKEYPADVQEQAFAICDAYGLSPLLGHVVIQSNRYQDPPNSGNWKVKHTPYVTRDGFMDIAHRTGIRWSIHPDRAESVKNPYTGHPDILLAGILKRQGYPDYKHEVWFSEFNSGKAAWKSHPGEMHLKVLMYRLLKFGFNISATGPGEVESPDDHIEWLEHEQNEGVAKARAASAPMTVDELRAEKAALFGEDTEPPQEGLNADTIRERVRSELAALKQKYGAKADGAASDKQLDYLRSLLGKAESDDEKRHSATMYLIGKTSTKDVTQAEASALISWLKDAESGGLRDDAAAEVAACVAARMVEAGQQPLGLEVY
jgi:hypothetical protein